MSRSTTIDSDPRDALPLRASIVNICGEYCVLLSEDTSAQWVPEPVAYSPPSPRRGIADDFADEDEVPVPSLDILVALLRYALTE